MEKLYALSRGLLTVIAPAVCQARNIGKSIPVGAWAVDGYTDDATVAFSHCTARVPYRSGIYLIFSVQSREGSWQMGLANPQWKLPTGKRYPITYKIDQGVPVTDMATVLLSASSP